MAKLKRYTLSWVLWALALALVVVGILALTVWRPYQEVRVSLNPTAPFVVTKPGVLGLYTDKADVVKVETEAPDDRPINIAVGAGIDVQQWVAGKSYQEVSGMADATTLKSELIEGEISDTPEDQAADADRPQSGEVDPLASDMWYDIYQGKGTYTFTVPSERLDSALLLATNGVDPAPRLTLVWPTPSPNVLAWVSFICAALLAAVGGIAVGATRKAGSVPKEIRDVASTAEVPEVEHSQTDETESSETKAEEETEAISKPEPEPESEFDSQVEPESEAEPAPEAEGEAEPESEPETEPAASNEPESPKQSDLAFPSRRAIREAQKRGEATIVVDGQEFETGAIPVIEMPDQTDSSDESGGAESEASEAVSSKDAAEILGKRAMPPMQWRSKRGAERFGSGEEPKDK